MGSLLLGDTCEFEYIYFLTTSCLIPFFPSGKALKVSCIHTVLFPRLCFAAWISSFTGLLIDSLRDFLCRLSRDNFQTCALFDPFHEYPSLQCLCPCGILKSREVLVEASEIPWGKTQELKYRN